jgi:Na+/H+-dicarboxylate symporter
MDIKSLIKKTVLAAIFIAIIVGVFWLSQKHVTKDITRSALITIMAAAVLTYVYNRYFYDTVTPSKPVKKTNAEATNSSKKAQSTNDSKIRFRNSVRNFQPPS